MDIKKILADYGISAIALIAGAVGSILKVSLDDGEMRFRTAVPQIIAGLAFAGWGTGMLVKWLHLENNPSVCGVAGLALGLCGLFVAKGLLKWGKGFADDPIAFIKNKGGKSDDTSN